MTMIPDATLDRYAQMVRDLDQARTDAKKLQTQVDRYRTLHLDSLAQCRELDLQLTTVGEGLRQLFAVATAAAEEADSHRTAGRVAQARASLDVYVGATGGKSHG